MNDKVQNKFMSNLLQVPPPPLAMFSLQSCKAAPKTLQLGGKGGNSSDFRFALHLLSMIVAMDIGKQQLYNIRGPSQNFKQ